MNRYPWWKYAIIGFVLLVGVVYTLLVGADQRWLSTTGFLDKVDQHLKAAMA